MHIEDLIKLITEYGPYAFIVIAIIAVQQTYKDWKEAEKAGTSQEGIAIRRKYFNGAIISLTIFSAIGLAYWFLKPSPIYIFKGVIVELDQYDNLASDDLYFKRHIRNCLQYDMPLKRDEYFVVIKDKPFAENEEFEVTFNKSDYRTNKCKIKYTSEALPKYKIDFNEKTESIEMLKLSLKRREDIFGGTAFAKTPDLPPSMINKILHKENLGSQNQFNTYNSSSYISEAAMPVSQIIGILQSERSSVGKKIQSLDILYEMNDYSLKDCITSVTKVEPMILTLLDLTRHTDKELSFKAKKIINTRFDVDESIAEFLDSPQEKAAAIAILYRIEPLKAITILKGITYGEERYKNFINDIGDGNKSKLLIPTGSAAGDRYYVLAKWDIRSSSITAKLAKLFNEELINSRKYTEELALMNKSSTKKNGRLVYWYSKQWALYIAKRIEECGGKAYFVAGTH